MRKLFFLVLGIILFAPAVQVRAATALSYDSLIRSESFPTVYYYARDGFRYVFPNEETYFTWYENFDDVVTLPDSSIGGISIGGNVTYKPLMRMVKIETDPKAYAVDAGGVLRWVVDENVAKDLYGNEWNTMIDDISVGVFSNYTIGEDIVSYTDYRAPNGFPENYTITDDKNLSYFTLMDVVNGAYWNPDDYGTSVTINTGDTVMFANVDGDLHTFTSDDNSWDTGTLQPLESRVIRFEEEGIFTFHCKYHPEMTGTVNVGGLPIGEEYY